MKVVEKIGNRTRVHTVNTKPTRTQQQFKDKVNINSIMAKYRRTGLLDHVRQQPGIYADLTQLPDYQTAMQTVLDAQTTFNTLPSELRTRFANDPSNLINFLSDDKNYDEAVKLGLVEQKIPQEPSKEPEPKK